MPNLFRKIAKKYDLVPQQHNENNKWYKIVLMDHVEVEHLTKFIDELKGLQMDKKKKARSKKTILTQEEIEDKSLAIAEPIVANGHLGQIVLSFVLTIEEQKEINTEYILQILAGKR